MARDWRAPATERADCSIADYSADPTEFTESVSATKPTRDSASANGACPAANASPAARDDPAGAACTKSSSFPGDERTENYNFKTQQDDRQKEARKNGRFS